MACLLDVNILLVSAAESAVSRKGNIFLWFPQLNLMETAGACISTYVHFLPIFGHHYEKSNF